MNTKILLTCISAAALAVCAQADTVITDNPSKISVAASTTFSASTTKQTDYPSGLPTPIFWFDAGQTNGWVFSGQTVTKIPSLVGDRYLTTDQTVGHFKSWTVTGATYVDSVADLGGRPAIDFGEVHYGGASAPGLVFDGRSLAEDAAASNTLRNIGSVVAVYGSQNSGGYFLGGGGSGIAYLRNGENPFNTSTYELTWANALGKNPGASAFVDGMIRQDGLPNFVSRTGLSGAWQTLVFNATSAGSLDATGIGLNDGRKTYNSEYVHGGGQAMGELIIFAEKLSEAQCARLEAWLQSKWFGSAIRGWNGNAVASRISAFANLSGESSTLVRLGFNVAAGETLAVGALDGGHVAAATPGIDKTGKGAVAINDMTEYDGDFRLNEGTLSFRRRAIPTDLPPRRLARFDASDAESLVTVEENGTNFVTEWKGTADSIYRGERLSLTPAGGCARAFVRRDVFGDGKPSLDLGPFGTASGAFSFTTEGSSSARTLWNVSTIIAVVGVHDGGGHLGNNYFSRADDSPTWKTSLVSTSKQGTAFYLTDGVCFIDGVRRNMSEGYPHPGYMVIALQIPGFNVSTIGRKAANAATLSGGLRFSEIAIYNRQLTETELKDASAYLMDKWFGRAAPGYARKDGGRAPDLRTLEVHHAGTAIDVPSNAVVRVDGLNASLPFEKRGEGTLQLPTLRGAGDTIVVKAGKVVAGYDADPTSSEEMAPEPAFHLDASATNCMDIVVDGGTNYVSYWYDVTMRNYALQDDVGLRPYLLTDQESLLNGMPVVDFGPSSKSGRYMNFCRALNSIRAVYIVVGRLESASSILGSSKYCPEYVTAPSSISSLYDFARGSSSKLIVETAVTRHVQNGAIYINGAAGSASSRPSSTNWQIIELHPQGGAHASALACDRVGQLSQYRGGQRLAEVLIYTRPLSARERVATRNYLRAKWLPEQARQDLPADTDGTIMRPADMVSRVAELDAEDGISVAAPDGLVAKRLAGSGDVVKSGSGTLTVGDMSDYTGTISVEGGTLALSGSDPVDASAGFVASGRIFHADAMYGISSITNDLGVVSVTNWTSRHDPSWSAVPVYEGSNPTLVSYGTDGSLVAVDMALDAMQGFRFCKDGAFAHVNPIRSVFWVIGSQNGGGFLLGGGTNYSNSSAHYNFHRGVLSQDGWSRVNLYKPSLTLINSSADAAIRSYANWWMNGVKISPTGRGLSGDWDQISMVFTRDTAHTDAEGFAFDGRFLNPNSSVYNNVKHMVGNQRLAEVIIYDRVLSEAERLQNEAYLRTKWSIGLHKSASNEASVALAEGAVLDCGGTNQYVAAISGAGTVTNGMLTAGALVADAEATGCLAVEGMFGIPSGMTVELRNLPEITEPTYINLLRATSFAGVENLVSAVFVGESVPDRVKVNLVKRTNGYLAVRLSKIRGSILVIR